MPLICPRIDEKTKLMGKYAFNKKPLSPLITELKERILYLEAELAEERAFARELALKTATSIHNYGYPVVPNLHRPKDEIENRLVRIYDDINTDTFIELPKEMLSG